PKAGPCASAEAPPKRSTGSSTNANGRRLGEPIGHLPVARDAPRLNAVVQPRHAEGLIVGFVPVLGELGAHRLHLAQFVGAAREDLGLVSVPRPLIAETGKGHALRRALELGLVPFLPAVRSEEHTSELQSRLHLVCRLLLEKKKQNACAVRTHRKKKTRQIE